MSNDFKSIHEFDFTLICNYFKALKRQGPGSPEVTQKAVSFINELSDKARIADIGCGTGGQTMALANYCRTMNTPSARMIEKGISRLGRPINDVQVAIENVGNIEVAKLEKGLTVMATISGGAPMLGFLGTVTGMVRAFYEMANAGSGNIDITLLSGGIYEAMITTVGGLIVGIIAMFAYNYLVMLVDRVVNKMESRTMEFMDLLNEPAK